MKIRASLKVLEFEKGKKGILVGTVGYLGEVLDILIAAGRAGKLDRLLETSTAREKATAKEVRNQAKGKPE